MDLERIGLILLIRYMRQFQSVKTHLKASLREFLLALSSTLEISNQITQDTYSLRHLRSLQTALLRIDSLINYSIDQLDDSQSPPPALDSTDIKEQVMRSIIEVIDEEVDKISDSDTENQELKIEALQTVKSVLTRQMETENEDRTLEEIFALDQAANL